MKITIPVFVDTEDNPIDLIVGIEDSTLVHCLKLGDIEVPIQPQMFQRILITEENMDIFSKITDNFLKSNSWSSFRPPSVDGDTVVLSSASPTETLSAGAKRSIEYNIFNLSQLMTIIDLPEGEE